MPRQIPQYLGPRADASLNTRDAHRCTRRRFLATAGTLAAFRALPGIGPESARAQAPADAGELEKIAAAIPTAPFAPPLRSRRLLIFDLNVGYGGHGSIRTANAAFELMGRKTRSFETEIHRDPAVFMPASLAKFDAVFLNNTVGNLFGDPALRQSLAEFVYAGGGLMGVHGTSVAFTRWPGALEDWPEFGRMLGARGASHLAPDEQAFIVPDDPGHPIIRCLPAEGFERRDEFFRFGDPYSRDRVRVLLHIDTSRTPPPEGRKPFRADGDYAIAWIRRYGRGRIFYCAIAHNPRVFWDPELLRFYLAATQFALGDLHAPTAPSAKLNPAIRSQESLGWRKGLEADNPLHTSLSDVIGQAKRLGIPYAGASLGQKIATDAPQPLDETLDAAAFERIRLMLDEAGVTLLTLRVPITPTDAAGWRTMFGFARRIGVESLITESMPGDVASVGALCAQHDIRLAIACDRPNEVLGACGDQDPRIGACAEISRWARAGIDPIAAVRALGPRLISVATRGPDRPADASTRNMLAAIRDMRLHPTMFAFGGAAATADIALFDDASTMLAKGSPP